MRDLPYLDRSGRSRDRRYHQFPLLSIDDAQAPFAKLWKVYGVGIGQSPLYTPAERAALAWTDALTLVSKTHASDDAYEALRPHFSDKQIVDLTILIGQINLWNQA